MTDLEAQAQAWVEASCAAQGLPLKVSDRKALADVAELLAKREAPPAQTRQTGSKRAGSKRL